MAQQTEIYEEIQKENQRRLEAKKQQEVYERIKEEGRILENKTNIHRQSLKKLVFHSYFFRTFQKFCNFHKKQK